MDLILFQIVFPEYRTVLKTIKKFPIGICRFEDVRVEYVCILLFVVNIDENDSRSVLFSNLYINIYTFRIYNFESVRIFISLNKSEV